MNIYEVNLLAGFHHTLRIIADNEQQAWQMAADWNSNEPNQWIVGHIIGEHDKAIHDITQVSPKRCEICQQSEYECHADSLDAKIRRQRIEKLISTLSEDMGEQVEILLNAYLRHQLNECNTESKS